jgi:adenylate cyclase
MPVIEPRPSHEVEAVFVRTLRAIEAGDIPTLERLLRPSPEFRAIGSDPDEWLDAETFLPILRAQIAELGEQRFDLLHVEAWEAGEVAWGASRVRLGVGRTEAEVRVTAVFLLDAGVWRVAQWHASEGVSNEESLGFSLTTTLTEILDSIDIDHDLAGVSGEGIVTLMFTDVAGSTIHARELGDRRFSQLMSDHIDLVTESAERSGGQVIKAVGDGALLVFSSARAALRCAVEIQRGTDAADVPFAIRIGLHAGEVVRTDSDVMGFAVNKAARVTSAADGDQVVVSSIVRELVGADPSFQFGQPILAELKGIDGVHELVPVEWQISIPAPDEPVGS